MDRRLLGNILIFTLIILSGTGFLMYFTPFQKRIACLHTFFACMFMFAMIFHVANNKLPLTNYMVGKRLKKYKKLQSPFIFLLATLITVAIYFENPLLNKLYNWGNEFRNEQLGKTEKSFDYQMIKLDKKIGENKISIELKKGKSFQYPLFAVWLEDNRGNYIETLYISRVISSSTFDFGKKNNGKWDAAVLRRPEALPYWSHKRNIEAEDGLFVPLKYAPDLDAVSGATPTENFIISSHSNLDIKKAYKIFIELNQSYDWNEFYHKDKFPNDKIYSGTGQVGQPSLIYSTEFNPNELKSTHKIMKLNGHGHYSGKNGNLYKDLTKITTAKEIAERIIVSIGN